MEIVQTLKELYDKLPGYGFTPQTQQVLGAYLLKLRENPALLALAEQYHREIFEERKYTLAEQEALGEDDPKGSGLLFAAIYLARYEHLEEVYARRNIPGKWKQGALERYQAMLEKSYNRYGSYGLRGMYRSEASHFLLADKYILGRLTFEITQFRPPYYEVYRNRADGTSLPIALPGFFYMPNGRQKTDDYTGKLFEPYLQEEGKRLKGFTFDAVGNLCFTPVTLDLTQYEKVLGAGDDVLSVHIPEKGRMTKELVDEAFALADSFFSAYYPEKKFKAYVCSSWLLNSDLREMLPAESNILQFQSRFRAAITSTNWYSIYWHVFGVENFVPLDTLTPRNSFQQGMLDWVKAGKTWYNGYGYILK